MKTQFRILMWAAMLLAAFTGYSQCTAIINYQNSSGGAILFVDSAYYFYNDSSTFRQFIWSFGDGTDTTLTYQSGVWHNYATSGNYNVCLTVVDTASSCNVQKCDTVNVNLCTGTALFGNTTIGFGDDSFTVNIPGNGGAGYTGSWNFGDGNTASGFNTSHQYAADGNYSICYKVTGPGCADSICQQNNVTICQPFGINFTVSTVSINPYTAQFAATNPTNASYGYQWLFGDGGYSLGVGQDSVQHTYSHNGIDTVTLMVYLTGGGCEDSVKQVITVDRCGLNPSIYESSNGLVANFGVSTWSIDSNVVGGVSNFWDFPGGSPPSSSDPTITVTYPALGTYTSTLYVSTLSGCVDTFNQSFTLTPGVYSIGGAVAAGDSAAQTTVYLIVQDSAGHLTLQDSTVVTISIDSGILYGGAYVFNNLLADTYYVKAALNSNSPQYADYLPTYYSSSLSWSTATPVYVTNSNISNINIALTAGANPGGPGFVGGYVSQGAGLVLQQGNGNLTRGVGDALAGIQINLLTDANDAVAYTFTDVNGNYHFSHLAYGSYYIYAEQLNKMPSRIPFTLSPSDSSINNLNLSINSDSSYATAISSTNQISIQGIYPNPVVSRVEVQLTSQQSADAVVKLIDVLGRTAISGNTKLTIGNNHLELGMENLAAGVYELLIQTNDQHLTYKVVKAK